MYIIEKLLNNDMESTWYFPAENTEVNVAELIKEICRLAANLESLGVKKGDRIGLVINNSKSTICILYACWYLNAVVVPMRTKSGKYQCFDDYIQSCDEVCDFKLLVLDNDVYFDGFGQWSDGNSKTIYSVSQLQKISTTLIAEPVATNSDDIAIIQFSSGSTGSPKGVVVTHGMMVAQLSNLEELFIRPIGGTKVACFASWAPINHDMGMFVGVLAPIFQGGTNILAPPSYYLRNPMRWFRLMAERKVEVAVFTNSVLAKSLPALKRASQSETLDLSRCRIYLGAEKVSPVVIEQAYVTMEPFFNSRHNLYIGYGMAENALGATTTITGEIPVVRAIVQDNKQVRILDKDCDLGTEYTSVGVPYSNQQITVRNSQDDILPELMLGEIHVTSHCLSPGYYNNPSKTIEAFINGRFRTKDLGFWYLGQLYFVSRADDLIILNGQNIVPDDVEMLVEEKEYVRSSSTVLFELDDDNTGSPILTLLVESNVGVSQSLVKERISDIQNHVYTEIDLIINQILFCEKGTIEKTSSGKKRRKVIKKRFIEGQIIQLNWENDYVSKKAI